MVVVAALVFTVLAVRYAGDSMSGRLDGRLQALVSLWTGDSERTWRDATLIGNPLPVIVLATLLTGICLALRRWRIAILAIVGPGLTGVATTLLKPAIGRTIDGGLAYPSGHTGGATSLGLVTALLVISLVRPGPRAGAALLAAGALVAGTGMAIALVAGDIHYPTDTVGGFCTAVAMVLGSALVIEWAAERRARRRRLGERGGS